MNQIKEEIKNLESKLTGNMFEDMDTKEQIMALKREIAIQEQPSCNITDDSCNECLMCGS